MPTPIHRHHFTVLLAGLLAIAPTCVLAAQTSITINATIIEVQCTSSHRVRIRACAPAQEKFTTEPSKMMVGVQSGSAGARMFEPRYEIRLDPKRPVLIRTLLY